MSSVIHPSPDNDSPLAWLQSRPPNQTQNLIDTLICRLRDLRDSVVFSIAQ
jgi:hypothetical protein